MLEIRWHSRAGQGAVTAAKGLGDVISTTGKEVQAFALYGSAKRGAAMTAYNRVDDKQIINHDKNMKPQYVLVLDPALAYTANITENDLEDTKYIITTHLTTNELIEAIPKLHDKDVYTLDALAISMNTIGRSMPNTPMLGAFIKVSGMFELDYFKEKMLKVLVKFPERIIEANMQAITDAYNNVKGKA